MRRAVLPIGLVSILLSGCGSSREQGAEPKAEAAQAPAPLSKEAEQNIKLTTARAEFGPVDTIIDAPGQITWNEDRSWTIGVVATGKVIHVYAKVGDFVKAGQVLARAHTNDVHDTQANLRVAHAEQRRAEAELELFGRNLERMKRLLEVKAVSQMQVEQAENDVKHAREAVNKAKASVDREVQHLTEVLEISADLDDEPRPNRKPDELKELVPVKASNDGMVVERKVTAGSVVTVGQPVFVISDPESLWLLASFPESALPRLRVGAPVEVEVRAYPGRVFMGRIGRLGEAMDAQTRTLKVRIELPAQGVLKPEMHATVRLRPSGGPSVLTIPAEALQDVRGSKTVFVRASDGQFQPRRVDATVESGRAIVSDGLKEGEEVAVDGSYFLKARLLTAPGNGI